MGYSTWAKRAIRLHGLSRVVEVVKLGCWALGSKALWAKCPSWWARELNGPS